MLYYCSCHTTVGPQDAGEYESATGTYIPVTSIDESLYSRVYTTRRVFSERGAYNSKYCTARTYHDLCIYLQIIYR